MKFFKYPIDQELINKFIKENSKEDEATEFQKKVLGDFFFKNDFNNCSPEEADYFLVPFPITLGFNRVDENIEKKIGQYIKTLPYLNEKHIFFLMGDSYHVPKPLEKYITFQVSCHKQNFKSHCIYYNSWLAPVTKDIKDAKYKFSFMGSCLPTPSFQPFLRYKIKKFCQGRKDFYFEEINIFFQSYITNQLILKKRWEAILNDSQFVLCPRGVGLNSMRFFETLSYNRIPILIADETRLPLENIINYNDYCIRIKENDFSEKTLDELQKYDISQFKTGLYDKYFKDIKKFFELNLRKIY